MSPRGRDIEELTLKCPVDFLSDLENGLSALKGLRGLTPARTARGQMPKIPRHAAVLRITLDGVFYI